MTKIPGLNELLQYWNKDILSRYHRDFPDNKLSAEQALQEILKFFWLGQVHRKIQAEQPDNKDLQFPWLLHIEMKEIDDM